MFWDLTTTLVLGNYCNTQVPIAVRGSSTQQEKQQAAHTSVISPTDLRSSDLGHTAANVAALSSLGCLKLFTLKI
jgi:hypothetical protein